MCGTVKRGAVARSGSKTSSRTKGTCRNLGGLVSDRTDARPSGPRREGDEPKPAMHGHEKSDPVVVAMKPANGTGTPGMERVERRAGAEGNANRQSTHRAQNRERVSQALERVRQCRRIVRASPSHTRGGSRMRESRTYGSVRGAPSNGRPYRDRAAAPCSPGQPRARYQRPEMVEKSSFRAAGIRPADRNELVGMLAIEDATRAVPIRGCLAAAIARPGGKATSAQALARAGHCAP